MATLDALCKHGNLCDFGLQYLDPLRHNTDWLLPRNGKSTRCHTGHCAAYAATGDPNPHTDSVADSDANADDDTNPIANAYANPDGYAVDCVGQSAQRSTRDARIQQYISLWCRRCFDFPLDPPDAASLSGAAISGFFAVDMTNIMPVKIGGMVVGRASANRCMLSAMVWSPMRSRKVGGGIGCDHCPAQLQ